MCKKVVKLVSLMCVLIFVLTGCAKKQSNENIESVEQSGVESEEQGGAGAAEQSSESGEPEEELTVSVASLKGPTSIGLVKMMKDNDGSYEFGIYTTADEIVPLFVKGSVDIASIPANLAAVLYQKTEGQVEVLDINTLGVLYAVSFSDEIVSVEDLRGKTVYMTGKGTTPEYALNHILSQNDMTAEDLKLEFKSEATEVISAMKDDENAVAILPQPYVVVAQTQLEGLMINISLTEEWQDMVTGVTIVNKQFAADHPEAVEAFLKAQSDSVDYVNENVEEMAEAVEEFDIVKAAVAQKAIPYCNLVCIQGGEMKEMLQNYLTILYEQDASSVGGQLPEDDFYFNAE